MKKLAVVLALGIVPFTAARADKDIGCGLGTMIWAGEEGLLPKVLGATTNGSFGNQTFGITSGTLGCSPDGVVKAEARRAEFASANIDQLAVEVAAGKGETLDTLARLYGVQADDHAAFVALAKASYPKLFASAHATTADVLAALDSALASDPQLARYVG